MERLTRKSAKEAVYTSWKPPDLSRITVKFDIRRTTLIAQIMGFQVFTPATLSLLFFGGVTRVVFSSVPNLLWNLVHIHQTARYHIQEISDFQCINILKIYQYSKAHNNTRIGPSPYRRCDLNVNKLTWAKLKYIVKGKYEMKARTSAAAQFTGTFILLGRTL